MKLKLLIILTLFSFSIQAQVSDFITVKKRNNRTLKTFFPGSSISFETVYGNFISGIVESIRHDSLFVKMYDIRTVPTQFGVTRVDTFGSYNLGYHYKDIAKVDIGKKESFVFIKNGTIFMIGGLGYALLNVVNGKYLNESITSDENLNSLGIALGVAGAGFIMNRIYRHNQKNGRKYNIIYVRMTEEEMKKLRGF
jgi:hypothetical protein